MKKKLSKITIYAIFIIIFISGFTFSGDKKEMSLENYEKAVIVNFKLEQELTAMILIREMVKKHGHSVFSLYHMCLGYGNLLADSEKRQEKTNFLENLFAYSDSLKSFCENDKIKRKYKIDCEKHLKMVDSIKVKSREEIYGEN